MPEPDKITLKELDLLGDDNAEQPMVCYIIRNNKVIVLLFLRKMVLTNLLKKFIKGKSLFS